MKYTHKTNKRAKRLIMKLNSDGELIVTTPPRVSKRNIEKFISGNSAWIEERQKEIALRVNKNDGLSVSVFGKKYKKKIVFESNSTGIKLNKTTIEIHLIEENTKNLNDKEAVEKYFSKTNKQLIRFLKNTAEKYIVPRTHQVAKHMDIKFGNITLRQQKTRWGSCSSTGNLNFNWRLIHHPVHIIDYVIVHEIAHRKHMDHSKNFWEFVEEFDPAYRMNRGWLKRNGNSWK